MKSALAGVLMGNLANGGQREGVTIMDQTNQQPTMRDLARGDQPQDVVVPAEIRAFLESILKDANMSSLDEQMHDEMITQLFIRLDNFLISRIVEAMPEAQLEEFISMQEKGAAKPEVEAYIQKHIPNAQQVFLDAFTEFRQLYLTNVSVARNAPGGATALMEEKEKQKKEVS